jgi:hypothetical protein
MYHLTLHWQGYIYMSRGNALFITLHYTDTVLYSCLYVILYWSPYSTLTMLYIHVRRWYFIYHLTLHWQGCIYMSVGNTVFITLHYTDMIVYIYMSRGNTLFITLHYTDKVVYTCQDAILYLSPYTTLTRLYMYIHVMR